MDLESKQTLDEAIDRLEAAIARQLALANGNVQNINAIIERVKKLRIVVTFTEE